MTAGHDHNGASSEGDALVARAIDSVVIVDDARDTFAENEPTTNEIEDLWSKVEFDDRSVGRDRGVRRSSTHPNGTPHRIFD